MRIRISRELSKDLERFARLKGVSRSEYARDALGRYVGLMRFRELQAQTVEHVRVRGIRVKDVAK